jgi:hypothetical protein
MPTNTRAVTPKAKCNAQGKFKCSMLGKINGANCHYLVLTIIKLQDLLRHKGVESGWDKGQFDQEAAGVIVVGHPKPRPPPPQEDQNCLQAPTKAYRGYAIIDLTLDSPPAIPTKSVPKAVESKDNAKTADSLGALKLQDVGVDAGGALADDNSKENVTHGRGQEIKEGMHVGKEEMREDDAIATVAQERRHANDQVQKQCA